MYLRRISLAVAAAALFIAGLISPAQASDPVTIPPGTFVVDESDVLSADEQTQLEQQITELQTEYGATLFAIFVPSFENPSDPEAWVESVAEQKHLGSNDNILAVATDDRLYYFVTHSSGPFRAHQEEIDRAYIRPELSQSDWFGAAEATINGLKSAADGTTLVEPENESNEEQSSGGFGGVTLIVLAAVIVGGYLLFRNVRDKKDQQRPGGSSGSTSSDGTQELKTVDELRQEAGTLLVQADDAIKVAEQEVGFAQATYGDRSVEVFLQDIATAKEHMQQSFLLQHQLDDHIPDTVQEQYSWLHEIIDRSNQVLSSLQAHEADFAQLRDLEKNAPAALEQVKILFAPLGARQQEAVSIVEGLSRDYDGAALREAVGDLEQANGLLEFGKERISIAQTSLENSDLSQAAWNIHEAENTTQELKEIYDSIQQLPSELDKAQRQLRLELDQTSALLAESKEFASQQAGSILNNQIASVEQITEEINQRLPSNNPLKDLNLLDQGVDPLVELVQPMKDAKERMQSALRDLGPALDRAHSTINSTDNYIRHRRGAVRQEARTKLSAARTHLRHAEESKQEDPVQALADAQRALQLAREAQQLAEDDYDTFDDSYRSGSSGSNRSAMLSGILLGHLLGGGGGGSSFGGQGSSGGFFGGSGGGFGGGFGGGGGGGFGGGSGGSF